jgi:hypothetical protein
LTKKPKTYVRKKSSLFGSGGWGGGEVAQTIYIHVSKKKSASSTDGAGKMMFACRKLKVDSSFTLY